MGHETGANCPAIFEISKPVEFIWFYRFIFLNLRRLEHKEVKEQKVHEPSENMVTKQEPTALQSLRLASQ